MGTRKLRVSLGSAGWAIFALVGCSKVGGLLGSGSSIDITGLPELSSFESSPLTQFIVDADGMTKISRTQPLMGSEGTAEACQHNGAHVHFTDTGSDYTVNILAPGKGVVSYVDPCKDNGDNDKVDLWLAIAQSDGDAVELEYSIEPMAGHLCSNGGDESFFDSYILVEEGQEVEAGEVIARFYRKASTLAGDDSAHIHYSLRLGDSVLCPDIFDTSLKSTVFSLFNSLDLPGACRNFDFSESTAFCVNPSAAESPF